MSDAHAQRQRRALPREHATYPGHFPGNPIVPGVLLLELILEAVGRGAPHSVQSVKFHQALKPGDTVDISWADAADITRFRCERAGELIAEGSVIFGATP